MKSNERTPRNPGNITPPTDGFASKDTCDHSHFPDPHNPDDRDRAPGCWFGVDSYLDSFHPGPGREPYCGFDQDGNVNRDTTDIDPPESVCETNAQDWVDASPRVSWDCLCFSQFGPVFVANGGGPDPNIATQAETVPLREAQEFQQALLANFWSDTDAVLCTVDTTLHATAYEGLPCDDGDPSTVFGRTIAFFNEKLTA